MEAVLPDRLAYFLSPWNVFLFPFLFSLSLALSLCLCPHFVCLSDFPPFFVSFSSLFLCKKTLHLFGQVCGDEMMILLVECAAQTRAVHPGGWWAMLILFWEHVAVVIASALPLPSTCHLVGGVLSSALR